MADRLRKSLEPVASAPRLPDEEREILDFWERERIFERSVSKRPADQPFVFFEGPPTANGKPGIHHVIARAFKDAVPRYQTMRGKRVERRAGWDTHGLPVELQVEKQLGISGKRQIENIVDGDIRASVAKFNALCRESVWQYKDEWERLTKRMGFWLDLNHPYVTYENDYIESIWWILSELWQRKLLYEDFKVVPYCPRCGTALSSHEVAQGYRDTVDQSVYVKFRVVGEPDTYLVAWTTTPWTLPGNVALAINQTLRYGRYRHRTSGEQLIVADERATAVLSESDYDREAIDVDALLALRYEPLFDIPALRSEQAYRVYDAPFVTAADGSGIVHTAVMYGEDDFQLGAQVDLPKHHTVTLEGRFTDDVPSFAGRFVKEEGLDAELIEALASAGQLLKTEQHTHSYPFCWRCDTPLIYYAKASWFIRMSALREALLKNNASIKWVPAHLQDGRFGEWLKDVKDWALSRDRYWGTPLPVWACDRCPHKECVSGRAALRERGATVPDDLHKPYIDDVTYACSACEGGTMRRYPEVIDVWFDSGAMPLAQWHYPAAPESEQAVATHYPADYISEAIDQTRGWFYTLLAIATALGKEPPYRSVISMAHILDKYGKKMSKSRGNVVDPWVLMDEFGVDPLRWYFYSVNQPGDPKRFDAADVGQVVRKYFLIVWNTYSFLATASAERGWQVTDATRPSFGEQHVLDRWLAARTDALIAVVTEAFDALDLFRASRAIAEYATELSTWYLRLSRKREDGAFLPTLWSALRTLSLLSAPLSPFFAESLWQRLRTSADPVSVHLASWPVAGSNGNDQLLHEMERAQELVERGRARRAEVGIKLRQPLRSASITGVALSSELADLLATELNVKSVHVAEQGPIDLVFDTVIDDALRAEGLSRDVGRAIQSLRKSAGLQLGDTATITLSGPGATRAVLEPHIDALARTTISMITWSDESPRGAHTIRVDDLDVTLGV
ncbi:MAG: isoleucine--tRNA ligase [Patescibacteria group bacterium]|jgi:isoleucyl-tRNA synthetase